MLDQDALKSVGVSTIGQRLAILKAIYQTKLAHNIPLDPDGYVPPCLRLSLVHCAISLTLLQLRLKIVWKMSLWRNCILHSRTKVCFLALSCRYS
jgi:hypothetical protein